MKIVVSQQDKKLHVTFKNGKVVDKYLVDKAEEFLLALDKFFGRRNIRPINHTGQIGRIKFVNTGMLTERIIRAIIAGLRF